MDASRQTFFLVALRSAGVAGLPESRLLHDARREGFADLTLPMLDRDLRDLADHALVHSYEQPILGQRWRISALGLSQLQEAGL